MAKINRPNISLSSAIFGQYALQDEITAFGDTLQTKDIAQIINDNFKRGWAGGVDQNGIPAMEWFNAVDYTLSYLTSYILQQGIPEWNVNEEYFTNSYVVGSNGKIYRSLTDNNIGNDPTVDNINWAGLDADKLNGYDASQTPAPNKIPVSDNNGNLNNWIAQGSGSGLDADLVRGLPADFTATFGTSGYQKLPSGLIIQWGILSSASDSNGYVNYTFPLTFPNACFSVSCVDNGVANTDYGVTELHPNYFRAYVTNSNGSVRANEPIGCRFIAIGY